MTNEATEKTFRQRVVDMFESAFGPAQLVPTVDGPLFRWVLRSASGEIIRLTLDAPEFPHLAHIIISDPRDPSGPLISTTFRTITAAAESIDSIHNRLR